VWLELNCIIPGYKALSDSGIYLVTQATELDKSGEEELILVPQNK
jgi:hypothetical protein